MNYNHVILTILCFTILTAVKDISANKVDCNHIATTRELVQCTLQNHPELQILRLEKNQKYGLKTIASQIPNINLNSRVLYGTSNSTVGGELNLKHVFELGAKRASRIDKVQKVLSVFEQTILIKQQEIVIDLLLTLHRIRQLDHELELITESSKTYTSVRQKFNKQPRLSPEQEMSANIYLFAISENQQYIRILKSKYITLLQKIRFFLNNELLEVEKLLPKAYVQWPTIRPPELQQSPFLLLAKKKVYLSKALHNLERSKSWPNLQAGPSFDFQNRSNGSQPSIGANFSFSIPLYHHNQGQIKYTKKGVQIFQLKEKQIKKKLNLLRNSFLDIYENSTNSLNIQKTLQLVKTKHERLHQLLRRGIANASIVIELHRKEFQLIKAAHENELNALRALWNIYSIDGTIFTEVAR